MKSDKIFFGILVILFVVFTTFLAIRGARSTNKNTPQAKYAYTDGAISVVRVPVFGKYVTCVKFEKTVDTGGAGGLSCDWVGYHQ